MSRNLFWGAALLLVGLLLLASNLGYIAPFSIWSLWPILIISPALKIVMGFSYARISIDGRRVRVPFSRGVGLRLVALWFLAGATAELLSNLSLIEYDWGDVAYWTLPLLLVGLGLMILLRPGRRSWGWSREARKARRKSGGGGSFIPIGDLRYGSRPWDFNSPMDLNLWVGDVDMDLTTASFEPGDNYLSVRMWAGDLDVRAPRHIEVIVNANCSAGEIRVFQEERSGVGIDLEARRPALEGGPAEGETRAETRLFIGIDMTFGNARIR